MGKRFGGKSHKKNIFYRKKSLLSKSTDLLRSFDMYGKNIMFTYKGESQYKTHLGGIISVFVFVVIIAYIVYIFRILFTRVDKSISSTSLIQDIYQDSTIHYPAQSNFDIAFKFVSNGTDIAKNSSAFSLSLNLVEQDRRVEDGVSKISRKKIPLEFEK